MNEDKIDSYVDRSGVQSDTQFMLDNLNQIKESYLTLSKIRVGINGIEGLSQLAPMLKQASDQTKAYDQALSSITAKQSQFSTASKNAAQAALLEAKANRENAAAVTEATKQKLNEAKATTEEARASKEAAQAKLAEAKASTENARAKQIEAKYTEQLEQVKKRVTAAAAKEADAEAKTRNEYEQKKYLLDLITKETLRVAAAYGVESKEAQALLKIQRQRYQELTKIENAVGRYQRNVGNYTQATFALTQVLREAPAFANSFAIGISAISNNLPMLIDEIKKLSAANVALKAAGEKTIPVFKTLASSIFSLTGILPIAFLFVQLFAKDIQNFVGSLFGAEDATKKLTERLGELKLASERAKESLAALRREAEFLKEIGDATAKINFGGTQEGDYTASRLSLQAQNLRNDQEVTALQEKLEEAKKRYDEASSIFFKNASEAGQNLIAKYTFFKDIPEGLIEELSDRTKKLLTSAKGIEADFFKAQNELYDAQRRQGLNRLKIRELDDSENKRLAKEAISETISRYDQEKKAAFEAEKYKLEQAIEAEKKIIAIRDGLEAPQLERAKQARERQAAFEMQLIEKTAAFERSQGNVVSEEALANAVRAKLKRQELTQAELAIVKEAYEEEVKSRRLTQTEISLINTKANADRRLALFAWVNETKEMTRLALKELAAYAEETSKLLKQAGAKETERQRMMKLTNAQNSLIAGLAVIDQTQLTKRTDLTDLYFEGKISKERYERDIYKIEYEYTKKSLQLQIAKYSAILTMSRLTLTQEEQNSIQSQLDNAQKSLQQLNINFKVWAKTADSDISLLLVKYGQVAIGFAQSIGSIFLAANERQKNAIQEQIDLIELKKQKDIEAAEQSAASQEEAAARIAVINAKAQNQREILERRQAVLNQKRARFEKAITISQIIADTALAVVRALGQKPYTPANIANAAIVGVLGAAKLAAVIATPIPQYKDGKPANDNYEGPAIVGDGGKRELIQREDGTMEVTPPTPTLTYVKRKDIVHPDASIAMKLTTDSMAKKAQMAMAYKWERERATSDMEGLRADLNRGFKILNRTIQNKKENHYPPLSLFDKIARYKDGNKEYFKK